MTASESTLSSVSELQIGKKISELRQKRSLTLQDLSLKTGISKSLLSEIESSEIMPPVATLITIGKALKVGMSYFFKDQENAERISITRSDERIQLKRRPHHHEGEVDYSYELLESKKQDRHMEPLLVEFKPMETKEMIFVSHEGEEFLFLLEGSLEFRTDDRAEVLNSGDSLYFDSDISHSFRALENKSAKAVVVVWSKP